MRQQHIKDLISIRMLIRSLIDSPRMGRKLLGDHLTKLGHLATLERIFEEEINYNEMVQKEDQEGWIDMPLPKADMSIVKEEPESEEEEEEEEEREATPPKKRQRVQVIILD